MKNNDTPPNASDISIAQKRLARELRIFVVIQVVALFVATCGASIVLLGLDMALIDGFGSILGLSGIAVSSIIAFCGCYKLQRAVFLPVSIRTYGSSGVFFIICLIPLVPFLPVPFDMLVAALIFIYPFYGIIPQYFIARWLARQMEIDSLEQIRQESIALRRELGLPGGALTDEQQKIYLEAKRERWQDKNVHQLPKQTPTR